jgi:hypothetical protein
MDTFTPLELIRAHPWSHSFFTTYALSLSFFEAVVLDALVRQNVERTVILADVDGVRAALAEYGSRFAGRVYEVEPVAVAHGCFHPKLMALTSSTEAHLVVGSGNLTFGGWGSNLECVEHLHPGIAGDAFDDAADFLESLASAPWIKHHVEAPCVALAEALRRFASTGVRRGSVRLLHSLDRSIRGQIAEFATDLGGAERLTLAAPFHDAVALDRLCDQLGLDEAFVHSHSAGIRARATLFQRDESEARWNDPTRTPGHPRPPKFVRVEPNLAVNQLEFPAPQPVALPATCAKKPLSRFVASSIIVAAQDINGRERQRRGPRTFAVPDKSGPASV